MTAKIRLFLLTYLYYNIFVECYVPDLSVRRIDKNFIAKKRQDTLDMCRIFNEESRKTNQNQPNLNLYKPPHQSEHPKNRFKRSLDMNYPINPALGEEDAKRVEKIVDKLYEDIEDVTLRPKKTKKKKSAPKPSRRFDFKPSLLLGPSSEKPPEKDADGPDYVSRARWKHGIVPYFIDPKTYDTQLSEAIILSFDYVEKATCIRLQKLREKPTDKKSMKDVDWIYITNPTGIKQCVHSNENRRLEGVQMIVFGYNCMGLGDIVHEVMHILGFSHEHLRSDRDQYVSVLWDNIKPGYKKYFDPRIARETQYKLETLPYDYASILHYPPRAFSKNGQLTILTEHGIKIGQREGLSEIDIEKVGLIYSGECVDRNREYLLKTCPTVVKADIRPANVTQVEIEDYFRDRIWSHGIVYYKFKDDLEFSAEERENIRAVFRHIEKETCIMFQTTTEELEEDVNPPDAPLAEEDFDNNRVDHDVSSDYIDEFGKQKKRPEIIVAGDVKLTQLSHRETLTGKPSSGENVVITGKEERKRINRKKPIKRTLSSRNVKRRALIKNNTTIIGRNNTKKPDSKTNITLRIKKNTKSKKASASRRHLDNAVVLSRSSTPGCKCPPPRNTQTGEHQTLELSADCFNSVNDLLHFFVHVLGLDHQHNMYDRDSYLHIIWENLTPEIREEMNTKLPPAASVGFAYDYQSVMHYPWLEIKNGVTNIMYPVWNDGWAMGHWQGLSSTDVQKLNMLYFNQCAIRGHHDIKKGKQ